jgi:hypothetical protein
MVATHDGARFKPMPDNARFRPAELRAFAAVSGRRRGRLSPGEHGEQAAGEGQCPNRSSRLSNHVPNPSRRDGMPTPDGFDCVGTLHSFAAFVASHRPDHERAGFIPCCRQLSLIPLRFQCRRSRVPISRRPSRARLSTAVWRCRRARKAGSPLRPGGSSSPCASSRRRAPRSGARARAKWQTLPPGPRA